MALGLFCGAQSWRLSEALVRLTVDGVLTFPPPSIPQGRTRTSVREETRVPGPHSGGGVSRWSAFLYQVSCFLWASLKSGIYTWRHRAHPLFSWMEEISSQESGPQNPQGFSPGRNPGCWVQKASLLPAEEGGPSPLHLKHTYLCVRFHYQK